MFNIKSVVYPEKIVARLTHLSNIRPAFDSNAIGTAANFSCGSFVRFLLSIDGESHIVVNAVLESNGCGYMLAAADVLTESVINKRLIDLHGLADSDLNEQVCKSLGEIPSGRSECIAASIEALRAAFADFRSRQIEEFQGEKALICTCFGVTEETIELKITEKSIQTVDEVTRICNAGGGCGSCRMLIQEMLDSRI